MKKNLAKAMAAAMAVGGVVAPTAQVVNAASVTTENMGTYDVRTAITGEVVVTTGGTVKSRTDVFDSKGTAHIGDDTIKATLGEGARVLVKYKGTQADLSDEKYVVVRKATTAEANAAKATYDTVTEQIKKLKADGFTITQEATQQMSISNSGGSYTFNEGTVVVKATKAGVEKVFTFTGVDSAKVSADIAGLRAKFTRLNLSAKTVVSGSGNTTKLAIDFAPGNTALTGADKVNAHEDLNRIKYLIEKNAADFEVVKVETNSNQDLQVTVYAKGIKEDDKKLVTIELSHFAKVDKDLVKAMPLTSDFSSHWAKAEIEEAMLKGWVDASSSFRPNAGVTRAEFAKMVCTIMDIDHDEDTIADYIEPFSDVNSSQWYYEYVVALYNYTNNNGVAKKGAIINGYEDGTFKPNAAITREEATKMIAAAYEIKKDQNLSVAHTSADDKNGFSSYYITTNSTAKDGKVDITRTVNGQTIHRDIKTKFKDDAQIAAWADEAVAALSGSGSPTLNIVGGNPDGTFAPKSNITRAEALVIMNRAK